MAAKDKDKEAALPEGQAEKPRKKSRLKRLVIILAILLMTLGGAGIGAYWWLFLRTPVDEVPAAPAEAGAEAPQGAPGKAPAPAAPGAPGQPSPGARIERQSDLPRSGGLVLPLPPVTVNLSDPGGRRYLKLGMEVEVNADVSAELKANSARIRDAVIMLLAGKSYGDISTPDGKVLLKAEIAARLNQILGAQRVVRVYLTDFVVE
ncbi:MULTISPECIES: flagellar basal body-associated FliL family protein [unclassified Desulfovibrio]|uniref:flagellar basal body-associated FliL family protein n=1 Tax=unclassified Desulfovibrio TaxID=2593640 RepID=UPI0013E9CB06|nr:MULTISPECIES: flagellar basal body-associated FliL family protein [unclassified Desulfovibrio]